MQTQYGKLPIAIDPATGRAKVVRSGVERHAHERTGPPSPRVVLSHRGRHQSDASEKLASSPADAHDSKLEAARGTYLGYLLLAKDIKKVVHHPFKIDIGGRIYTPDYLVWWADGRITVEEVKGSLKSKNARDSITRLHVAASMFPMFIWHLVTRVGRTRWTERHIPAGSA